MHGAETSAKLENVLHARIDTCTKYIMDIFNHLKISILKEMFIK